MSGIIWLASYPKSGNTWMRAFLANFLQDRGEPVPINDLPNHILGDGFLVHYKPFLGQQTPDPFSEQYDQVRAKVHQWFAASSADDVFVKTHSLIASVHGVPLITPAATAGAIYIVRNPLDVATSFAHHFKIPVQRAVDALCTEGYHLPATEDKLVQYIGSWGRHLSSWTGARGMPLHVVRYEDLVQRPVKAFSGLVRFLGLPMDRARVMRAIDHASFEQLQRQESESRFVEAHPDGETRFFRRGQVGGWRDTLDSDQVRQLIDAHGALMTAQGYLSKGGKPRGI